MFQMLSRRSCPICSSKESNVLFSIPFSDKKVEEYLTNFYENRAKLKYLVNKNYILIECLNCKCIYQKNILDSDGMRELYENWAISSEEATKIKQNSLDNNSEILKELLVIISYFKKMPHELTVLDFGMGSGKWAMIAKALGCNVYGFDLSSTKMKVGRDNGINCLTYDQITKLRFDFINTEQVFEHLPEPTQTLQYLSSTLKNDGLIKISVPFCSSISKRIKKLNWSATKAEKNSLGPIAPLEHINFFRRESIIIMGEKASLKEILIPMKLFYRFNSNWDSLKGVLRNFLLPIYLNILKRRNYIFLKK
tara:strand:+ start:2606 stop:3532 length:927 start_codon:yes stop_codon:yes gene_type:complete